MAKFISRCTNSMIELWVWLFATLAVAAALFSWFEGIDYWRAFYWACVTATSTGYGDISPKTLPGQILSICLMFMALFFILPLMIARVINALVENRDAWTHEEQEQLLGDVAAIREHFPAKKAKPIYAVGDFVEVYDGMGECSFGKIAWIEDHGNSITRYKIHISDGGGFTKQYRTYDSISRHSTMEEAREYFIARSGGKEPQPSDENV